MSRRSRPTPCSKAEVGSSLASSLRRRRRVIRLPAHLTTVGVHLYLGARLWGVGGLRRVLLRHRAGHRLQLRRRTRDRLLRRWHRARERLCLGNWSDHLLWWLRRRARERLLLRSRSDHLLLRLRHWAREWLLLRSRSDHPWLRLWHRARPCLLRRCQVTPAIRFARLNRGSIGPHKLVPGAVVPIGHAVAVLGYVRPLSITPPVNVLRPIRKVIVADVDIDVVTAPVRVRPSPMVMRNSTRPAKEYAYRDSCR